MGWERERGKNRDHLDAVADVDEAAEPWRPSPGKVARTSRERGPRRRRRGAPTPGGAALTVGMDRRRRGARIVRPAGSAAAPSRDAAERLQAARASSGAALPDELARRLGAALGAAVTEMRVHVGAAAAAAARALRAEAFTVGRDIYFAEGAFDPSSDRGERLIAHEAAHAASQPGTVSLVDPIALSEPGDAHEREADAFADAFAAGRAAAGERAASEPRGAPGLFGDTLFVREPGSAREPFPGAAGSEAAARGWAAARVPGYPAAPAPIAPAPAGIYRAVAARRASDDEESEASQDSGPGTGEGQPEGDGPDDRGPDGETDEADRERDGDASAPVDRPQRAPLADGDKRAEVQAKLPQAPGERNLTERKQPGPQGDKGDKDKQPPVPKLDGDDGGAEGPVAPRNDNVPGEGPQAPQASTSASIQFAPTDLSTLLPPIGPDETIEERRATERAALESHEAARAHAVESLTSFAAASGQQADGMRAMQPGLDAQLAAGETRALGAVDASASRQIQAVRAHVASAISLAEGAAASARAAVEAEHGRTVQQIESTTAAAKQKIDAAHKAKLQGIEQAQTEQLTLLGTLYAEAATKFRAAGTTSGAHAVSVAAGYASEYLSHKINRDDSFLDGPLTDNRCEARADAAKAVGESYRDGLAKEAEKQIVELNKRRPTDEGTVRTIADEARKQLQDAHRTTLEGLEAARKQSIDGAGQSRAALIAQIDNARTATVSGLNKHGRTQAAALQGQAGQIKQGIRQQRQQASVQIHDGIEQAIAAMHQGIQAMLGGLSGAEVPDPAALDAALIQADEALAQQVVQMGQSMTQAAGQTAQMLDQAAAQGSQALGQAGAAAVSTASKTLASARQSFSALQQSGVQAMQQLAAGHQQQCDASARAAETGFESIVTGLKGTYGKLTQSFRDGAQKNADAVQGAFMQAVDKDMPPVIKDEANAAAAKVQPRWKSVLKWVIIIAIILVVAIVIGPMVIGAVAGAAAALGATAGVASVVGAVVGGALVGAAASALTTVVDNAFSGRALLEGVAQAAMWGAIGGAVGGAVSSALGPAMKGMSIAGKVALSTTTDVVVDTGLNAIQGNLSWESFAQGLFMSVLTNGVTSHPRVEAVSGRFETAGNNFGGRVRPKVSGVGGSGGAGGGTTPGIDTPDVGGGTTPRVDAGGGGGGATPRVDGGGGATPRADGDGGGGGATTPKTDGGGGTPDGNASAKVDGGGGQPIPPGQGGQGQNGQGQGGTGARTDGQGARNDNAPRTGDGATTRGNDQGAGNQTGSQPRTDGQTGNQPRTDGQTGNQPRPDGQTGNQPRTDGQGDATQPGGKGKTDGEGDATQPGGKGKTDGEGDATQPGGKGKRDGDGQGDGQTRPRSDQGQGESTRTDGAEGDRTQGKGDRTEGEGATGDRTGDVEGGKTQDPVAAADSDPSQPVGPGGFQSDAISLTGKGDKLGDAVKWLKPEPGKIDVVVHGSADGFYVLKDGGYVKVDHRALAAYIKKNGGAGQDIRLISCGTGDSPTAIAQHLSNKLGVRVTAPTDTVWVHPDGRLTVGKNPTAETGGWNVFEPGTRPEVGGRPRAEGDGTTPDVDTTPGARTDEGGGGTRPPETDGTTPARSDDPDAPRAAGKDDDSIDPTSDPVPPADLPPALGDIRKNLTGDAARQFDHMWAQAKAKGKPDSLQRAIEGIQRGRVPLDEALASQWQKANAVKSPVGDSVDQLPALRQESAAVRKAIEDARGQLPESAVNQLAKKLAEAESPITKMEEGDATASAESVQGARNNLRALDAELRVALGETDVTDLGRPMQHTDEAGVTHDLEIDVVSEGGRRWIEVKNKAPFGTGSTDWTGKPGMRGLREQAELMVAAAKKNQVDGETPEVVIDFPRGVSREVADALEAMGVTVRGERVADVGARDVDGGGGKDGDGGGGSDGDGGPPGPVSAGVGPGPKPDTGGSGAKVEDGDATPTTDGISGGKVSREDFLGTQPTDGDLETAKQQAQAERGMSLDEQAASIATGTARSEREMLLAIQNGEMPRFIARVGPSSNFDRGTFANPNRPFGFAAEPADLRGASPAEAMFKVGWTREWIAPNIGKEIIIVCLDTEVAVPNAAGGSSKIETGRMEWPELKAMALADPKFAHDAEALGIDPADLPALFDLAAATPVKGAPVTGDAAQLARLRGLIDRSYGANELYTGMGATMAEDGTLGGREVMMRPGDTGLKLTDENHRRISLGVMTQAQFDALFPPAGGGGGGPVQRKATGQPGHGGANAVGVAERGVGDSGGALPHGGAIQQSFGSHDVGHVRAHTGAAAAEASAALGARAYTTGDHVAFRDTADLHTAAHEAAHVIQQRAGVAPKGLDGGAGDAFERHADEVADAVVRGESAEPLLDQVADRGGQGGTAVQRDEEYMTTERYIAEHRARLGPGTASALDTLRDSLATGVLAMYASLRDGVEPVVRRLREAIDREDAEPTLRRLCSPTSLESCVDRGRNTTRTSEDLITTGSDRWSYDVGTAIADAIGRNLRQSLTRVVGSYAAAKAAAQNAAWNEAEDCDPGVEPEPATDALVAVHPIDTPVIAAACAGELFQVDLAAWRSFHPEQADATSVSGLRHVLAGLEATSAETPSPDDHGRFVLWIRGHLPDSTAEEVARSFFGSTEYTHLLTVHAPPRYAFSATHVWSLPQALQDRIVDQSPELQAERERRQRRDTGEPRFIGFMVPRGFADDPEGASTAAQDPSAGLTPAMADDVALAGAGSAAPLPPGVVRDRAAVLTQMGQNKELAGRIGELAARFEELGMMAGDSPAATTTRTLVERIDRRRDELRDADEAAVLRWDVHARAQQEVLGGALAGLLQAHAQADQQRAASGGSDDALGDFSIARVARLPLQRVAMKFFAVAAQSDTPESARARLAEANQASQLYPAELMDLILQEVQRALAGVRNRTDYPVTDLEVRESSLRRQVAQLRQHILSGSEGASALMQEIFATIQDLQSETTMIANMDTIDATWAALGDMADSFGVWGEADERLRELQGQAVTWKLRWNQIYRDWTRVAAASGPEAERQKQEIKQRFDELRADPALAEFLGRAQGALQDAAQRALIAKLIALLAIVVLTMGAGSAVAGFVGAGGLGWGAAATTAAVVVTEAAVFTTLHTAAFVENPTLAGVAAEFGYNVLLFGALRGVSAALRVGRLGSFLAESGNLGRAELAGQGVVMGSMTLARAEIESRLRGGGGINAEEAATITAESTAMFVAMVVLGRVAQPLLQRIEGAAGELGAKIRIANQERAALAELARTVQDTKDLQLARELMTRDNESLRRDREALEELLRVARESPQVLRDQGMTDVEIRSMSTELGSGVKRMQVAELMRGVENVGGDTYVASRQEMAAQLANHQKAGAAIREGGVDRVTGRRWYEVDHGEGLKLRIFESSGEAARPGTPGQEAPSAAEAAELRAAAREAEAILRARDQALTELVLRGGDPVVADTVIIGSGQAGTLAHATVPGQGRAIPGVEINAVPGTFNVAPEGSTFARHGDFPLGQPHGELASPAMTRQPGEFAADRGGSAASSDYVRALTMTALDTGMATVRARVESVEVNPRDGSWLVDRPLRITLTGGKVVYVNTLVGAMGLGPPRPAGFAGEAELARAGKLVYAQESLALPGGGGRILVIGGGASGMWACEAAMQAGARSLLWSGRADPRAEVAPETRASLEEMGLTPDQISAFHTAYNGRNRAGFAEIGGKIELTTATLERATLTPEGKVRIESNGGVIEVDGVVVSAGQITGVPRGMEQMRFRIVTAEVAGTQRLIALDAVDPAGNLLGIRLAGAQIMNRGMARFIDGGPAEVQRYNELVTAVANDPAAPPDSRGVPGSIYQTNISIPEAMESLPVGGSHRPGQAGHPPHDDDREGRESRAY